MVNRYTKIVSNLLTNKQKPGSDKNDSWRKKEIKAKKKSMRKRNKRKQKKSEQKKNQNKKKIKANKTSKQKRNQSKKVAFPDGKRARLAEAEMAAGLQDHLHLRDKTHLEMSRI